VKVEMPATYCKLL